MFDLMLFTDGSVDTKTHIGFGAYLAIENIDIPAADVVAKVKTKQFDNTSSTPLELQTLLWALDDAQLFNAEKLIQVVVYSDSQNIVNLLARRSRLEQRDFYANNGARLRHAALYQEFFTAMDQCACTIINLQGHKPLHAKSSIDLIFSLVDKASRSALRQFNRQTSYEPLSATQ